MIEAMVSRFELGERLRKREQEIVSGFRKRPLSIEPLDFLERLELAATHAPRVPAQGGLTAKQAELLAALVGQAEGLIAKELEAWMARSSPDTGVVGWSAGDCTVSLHRLRARGLVRCERVHEGNIRLRWFLTPEGESFLQNRKASF